ncbi:MAG: cytosine permease [Pseudomonadota bacterium]
MFADNHAHEAVPADEAVSGVRIAQIYIGVAITLPAFLVGAEIFADLGLVGGVAALALSGAALVVLSSLTMRVGAGSRRSTYAIVETVFGRDVAFAINVLLALCLLGWFAVTVSLFGAALSGAIASVGLPAPPAWSLELVGGALMIGATLFGFQLIDRLSRIAVPLLGVVLAAAFFKVSGGAGDRFSVTGAEPTSLADIARGVSVLVGAFMVGVVIAPDIARFAQSARSGVVASVLSYGAGTQLVLFAAGSLVLMTGEKDFVANLTAVGFGWPALFVVVFATITTNVNNLYSASLGFAKAFPKRRDHEVTAAAGVIGVALALAGVEKAFIPFLIFLGVVTPPIAGVYVADYFVVRRAFDAPSPARINMTAGAAWLAGSAVALAATNGVFTVTGAAALDALLVSAVVYIAATKIFVLMKTRGWRANDGGI